MPTFRIELPNLGWADVTGEFYARSLDSTGCPVDNPHVEIERITLADGRIMEGEDAALRGWANRPAYSVVLDVFEAEFGTDYP